MNATTPFSLLSSISILILSVLFKLYVVPWYQKRKRFIEACNALPGPPSLGPNHPHPWLADVGTILSRPRAPGHPDAPLTLPLWLRLCQQYKEGGMLRLWLFNPYRVPFARPMIFVFDPHFIQQILGPKGYGNGQYSKGMVTSVFFPLAGHSLVALPDGHEWKRQRKLITPAFGHDVLEGATQSIKRRLEMECSPIWESKQHQNGLDVVEIISKLIIDVLGDVAFSYSFQQQAHATTRRGDDHPDNNNNNTNTMKQEEDPSLYDMFKIISKTLAFHVRVPLARLLPTKQNRIFARTMYKLNTIIDRIITHRIQEMNNDEDSNVRTSTTTATPLSNNRKDLLSQLLMKDKDGNMQLSQEYIHGNVRLFLFAGHDTTASVASFALWHLAKHPHIQERLRMEIDSFLEQRGVSLSKQRVNDDHVGENDDDNDDERQSAISYAELRTLNYLNAVIQETLRITPPGGAVREASKDITFTKGDKQYIIPKGAGIIINSWIVQNLSFHWEGPTEFKPERFLPENKVEQEDPNASQQLPHPMVPFSLGPRSCVGQELARAELRALLAVIVRRYVWEPAPDAQEPVPVSSLTVSPHEVRLRFRLRATND